MAGDLGVRQQILPGELPQPLGEVDEVREPEHPVAHPFRTAPVVAEATEVRELGGAAPVEDAGQPRPRLPQGQRREPRATTAHGSPVVRPVLPQQRRFVVGEEGQDPVVDLVAHAGGDPRIEPVAADPHGLGEQLRGERGEQVEALVHTPGQARRMHLVGGQRPGVLVADRPQRVGQGVESGRRVDQRLGGEGGHVRAAPEVQLLVRQAVAVVVEAAVRGERQVRHGRTPRRVRRHADAGVEHAQRVSTHGRLLGLCATGSCRWHHASLPVRPPVRPPVRHLVQPLARQDRPPHPGLERPP